MSSYQEWKYTQGGRASFPTVLIACLYDKQNKNMKNKLFLSFPHSLPQ